jgi:hypothetical protein
LCVEPLDLRGKDAGTGRFLGEEQFDGGICVAQPAQRVQARREGEADGFLGQRFEVCACQFRHHFQAEAVRAA